jgi:hypothetical protein
MKYQSYFRPFELLKLIRDKKINNIEGFFHEAMFYYREEMYGVVSDISRWQQDLQELGLIETNERGAISSTKRLAKLFNVLGISLTRLKNYSDASIICSPIFGRPSKPSVKSDIFVVMPFLKDLKPVYEDHIQSILQKMNLTVSRGDDFFTAQSIISDIWDAINSCSVVIADCTGRNPNVFYEIGMAHTLGKPVILISQNKEDIPFDIQYIRYILYEYTPRGMREFEKTLTSTIESELRDEFSYEILLAKMKSTTSDDNG